VDQIGYVPEGRTVKVVAFLKDLWRGIDRQEIDQHGSVTKEKKGRWQSYPYEPFEHEGHERATTRAAYGNYRVCYCYDCKQHYRRLDNEV